MITSRTIGDLRAAVGEARSRGLRIGFVPTMGYLHEGHLKLFDVARSMAGFLVASIFVNPTQFGQGEDFGAYLRDFDRDFALCRERGVDAIFAPSAEEMYPRKATAWVVEESLSKGLCGRSRPGHFQGVATVVAKLFNIVGPDVAVFGRKDLQQAAVIRRMVEDLNFPVEIVVVPTVREGDGLALSSRNSYLSDDERTRAVSISRGLAKSKGARATGLRDSEELAGIIRREIETAGGIVDYVEIVDDSTLKPVERADGAVSAVVAARFGPARLIDNLRLDIP